MNDSPKKWSLREHWKRASQRQRLEWVLKGLAGLITALTAIGGGIYFIASYIQNGRQFVEEHRPRIVFSEPPSLIPIPGLSPPQPGRVICQITDKAIHWHIASLRFWVGNGGGNAKDVFIPEVFAKIVPEQKTNNPIFDNPPIVNDETCKKHGHPAVKEIPLGSHLKTPLNIRQIAGLLPLFNPGNSITLGGGEPIPPPDLKPSDWTHIAPDAKVELYVVACVDYSGEDGTSYASCATYRFVVNGQEATLDPYGFSCQGMPLYGTFQPTFGGYCQD